MNTPVASPGDEGAAAQTAPMPAATTEQPEPKPRAYDSDTTVHNRASQDGLRAGARASASLPGPRGVGRRSSWDPEAPPFASPSFRRGPRYREEWDYEYDPEGRDYPLMRDHDRYWPRDYRPDRYTSRRNTRPPPSIFNRRGMMMEHDSDDDIYQDEMRYAKQPFETSRMRRLADEEMGYQSGGNGERLQRYGSHQPINEGTNLDWNNMSSKEKVEVLRIPLTQWMNSDIKNHFVATLGELVGTTMFLFFAFAGTEVANIRSEAGDGTTTGETTGFNVAVLLYISLSFGFSLMVNVWVFFRISGGLFNPAVTVAMAMVRAISIARAVCLFVAQIGGAILASAIVRYLFPESFNVRTTLGGGASLVQGIFIEAILTAELVFTIFMLAKEKHRATFIAPVGIGLALFIAELVGVQFTGGSLNPARSFGPCVIAGNFDSEHWIYCKLLRTWSRKHSKLIHSIRGWSICWFHNSSSFLPIH